MAATTAQANGGEASGEASGEPSAHRRPGRRRVLIGCGVALALVCGVPAAFFAAGRVPGDSMDVAWQTPADVRAIDAGDQGRRADGDGSWLVGDTLVRSGFNGAAGQDAGTGRRVWEYRSPGNAKLCAADADVDSAVLVVTRDDENRPPSAKKDLCTVVAGVDMRTGRELWRTSAPAAPTEVISYAFRRPAVHAGGGLAVLAHQALRAFDVRTGAPRWTAALPAGCAVAHARPAARHVGALLGCGGTGRKEPDGFSRDAELHAAAFDPATGRLLWDASLGDREPVTWTGGNVFLMSADPVIVANSEAAYSFSDDGRPNPPVEGSLGDRSIAVTAGTTLFTSIVTGGGGTTRHKSPYRESVLAIELTTGRLLWRADVDVDIAAFHLRDGRLTVVGERRPLALYAASQLHLLDAATGRELDERRFHYGEFPAGNAFAHKDLLIIGGTAYRRT
ncbi:PQQ-binding-like beta-propeller repeat protein [Streptomyces sp. NPDC048606]|uniref:outer membrane protein assembly factor BamB family protein n=1 Tax=Streptomyces sp. NPDC048606 TaxID=3154726 RepID=UPI00341CF71A